MEFYKLIQLKFTWQSLWFSLVQYCLPVEFDCLFSQVSLAQIWPLWTFSHWCLRLSEIQVAHKTTPGPEGPLARRGTAFSGRKLWLRGASSAGSEPPWVAFHQNEDLVRMKVQNWYFSISVETAQYQSSTTCKAKLTSFYFMWSLTSAGEKKILNNAEQPKIVLILEATCVLLQTAV